VGDACDLCPDEGGRVDEFGCPRPPAWESDTVLAARILGYLPPEVYEVGLDDILTVATLGVSEASISDLGEPIEPIVADVPLGVETQVFSAEDIFEAITTDTVTITTFEVVISGVGEDAATWTFDYTVRRVVFDGFFTDVTYTRFTGTQTGTVSADESVITWTGVQGAVERCADTPGCGNFQLLVPGENWTLGEWTLLD
jgi:hypothetical protein